jgi:hypothetical protein
MYGQNYPNGSSGGYKQENGLFQPPQSIPQQQESYAHPAVAGIFPPGSYPTLQSHPDMRRAGVHVQSSPMQALQQNIGTSMRGTPSGNAPPAGAWNRNMRHPNMA